MHVYNFGQGGDEMARSKYEDRVLPRLPVIARWCESGLTNDEIAISLGIARSTFQCYINKYADLRAVVRDGKDIANIIVEESVFAMSVGYVKTIKKPMKLRKIEYDDEGKKVSEEDFIKYVDEEHYVLPNVTSAKFYLSNRDPARWNEKMTVNGVVDSTISIAVDDAMKELMN